MVKIITDSAADFEQSELEKSGVICIPMNITVDGEEYLDNVSISKPEFYDLLESCVEFPQTSQPSLYEFEKYMQAFKENGDECVIITISSGLSGTYQNVVLTKNSLEYENCFVIDSLNATGGQHMLVDYAVKLRDEGKSAAEIAEELETFKRKSRLLACIDTLDYLYKGGRLSKITYTVGSMMNIKPIIRMTEKGKIEVCSKALSVRRGIRSICDSVEKFNPDTSYPFYIVYSHNRKNADILANHLRDMGYNVPEDKIVSIGATIGTHIGKNACGYICIAKE